MAGLLEGKIGFVTGASNGIGKGIALELAREGAYVVVSDIEAESANGLAVVNEIDQLGGNATFVACDVTDFEQIQHLLDTTKAIAGRLDFVVNNAGIGPKGMLGDTDDQTFDLAIKVNLRSTYQIMREAINIFKMQPNGGNILNISSVAGAEGARNIGIYAATKHAIIGLTKTAALEYGEDNVRVNSILPNAIRSRLLENSPPEFMEQILAPQAIKRVGEPEEVGAAAAFLLSDKAAFITGVSLPVDGGFLAGN